MFRRVPTSLVAKLATAVRTNRPLPFSILTASIDTRLQLPHSLPPVFLTLQTSPPLSDYLAHSFFFTHPVSLITFHRYNKMYLTYTSHSLSGSRPIPPVHLRSHSSLTRSSTAL
jgi:hypothetical protein